MFFSIWFGVWCLLHVIIDTIKNIFTTIDEIYVARGLKESSEANEKESTKTIARRRKHKRNNNKKTLTQRQRASQLLRLHEHLSMDFGAEFPLPVFPSKKFFALTSVEKDQRRLTLEKYVQSTLASSRASLHGFWR